MPFQLKTWNGDKLLKAVEQATAEFGPELYEQAREEITSRKWDWPGPTLRFTSLLMGGKPERGGVLIPEGKRDIVDTGTLLNSQTGPFTDRSAEGFSVAIRWTAPYAKNILLGQYDPYINPEGRRATPEQVKRDWIASTFQAKPFLPYLVQRWNQLVGGK